MSNPSYKPDNKRLIQMYEKAITELSKEIAEKLALDKVPLDQIADKELIIKQLEMRLAELDSSVSKEVEQILKDRYEKARLQYHIDLEDASNLAEASKLFPPSLMNTIKIEQIISDTMLDLLAATSNTEKHIIELVREVVAERVSLGVATGKGWEQISKTIQRDLTAKGLSKEIADNFIGIVDKAGKKWQLQTYADMITQTKLMQCDIEASRVEGLQEGIDLAVISQHGAKDACANWENVIISMNGIEDNYPTYQQVKDSNECFHPNCQHHLQPVRDISLIHKDVVKKSEQKMKQNKETLGL